MNKKHNELQRARLMGIEIAIAERLRGQEELGPYQVAKWLLYQLAKQDAVNTVRTEIENCEERIAKCRKAKGARVRLYAGSPPVPRVEALEQALVELQEWQARTMEDEAEEESDLANDDRDSFYDEDMWELGEELDPDFNKPITEWGNLS